MTEEIIYQTPPATEKDIIHLDNLFKIQEEGDWKCDQCGNTRPKSERPYKDSGGCRCKNCYSKDRYQKKKQVDLSKLQVDRKEDGELTFFKPVVKVKTVAKVSGKKWEKMTFEERQSTRKAYEKVFEKKLAKAVKEVPTEQVKPYISQLVADEYYYASGRCNMCGGRSTYGPALGFVIPNMKVDDNTIWFCVDCLKRSFKICKSLKSNAEQIGSLKTAITQRQIYNRNHVHHFAKDKNDKREYDEIREALKQETKKELRIHKDFPTI